MNSCSGIPNLAIRSGNTTAGHMFAQLIQSLVVAQCVLSDNSVYPRDRTDEILKDQYFDFIVVGSGTAGSVVASRLSENKNWKVLLIERGKDSTLMSRVPQLHFQMLGGEEDYGYWAEPNPRYCQGTATKSCLIPKGKGLGGSSLLNAMVHVRGNKKDFDTWASMGNPGWSYEEVLPYFKKSENYHPEVLAKFGQKYFGTGGPVTIREFNFTYPLMTDILSNAGEEMAYKKIKIFNAEESVGFGRTHATCDQGVRQDVARAFLGPKKNRKNLFVMKSTRVDSVVIQGKKALGVRVTLENGQRVALKALKEVVLSAGSIASPQLLMLSGVGPGDHLKKLGIRPKVDLPVGNNLQDHVCVFMVPLAITNHFKPMTKPVTEDLGAPLNAHAPLDPWYKYLLHKRGPLSSISGEDFYGYINVDEVNAEYPNFQLAFTFAQKGSVFTEVPPLGVSHTMVEQLNNITKDAHLISAIPIVLNPKSLGKIRLRSRKPEDPVKIFPNYYEDSEDVNAMLRGIEFLVNMTFTKSFRDNGVRMMLLDVKGCENETKGSTGYWKCVMRQVSATTFHQVGTAKMGPVGDPTTVVDPRLKVHGMEGLRVIDASVMPKIVSANPHASVMMIGEKGADMMKEDWAVRA